MTPPRSHRQEREFGLLVGAILLALGGWWLYRGKPGILVALSLGLGGVLLLLGAASPGSLQRPYRLWMDLAEKLAIVMTSVVLAIVFFGIVTPIGLARRALGGDPLRRRAKPADSYWWPYPDRQRDPRHYERMF
jgi:Saxitoxin biosynthesis operon protein SxtJ